MSRDQLGSSNVGWVWLGWFGSAPDVTCSLPPPAKKLGQLLLTKMAEMKKGKGNTQAFLMSRVITSKVSCPSLSSVQSKSHTELHQRMGNANCPVNGEDFKITARMGAGTRLNNATQQPTDYWRSLQSHIAQFPSSLTLLIHFPFLPRSQRIWGQLV